MELQALFEKYLQDRMTAEELAALQELVKKEGSDEELDTIIGQIVQQDRFAENGEFDKQAMIRAILRTPVIGIQKTPTIHPYRSAWMRYAAAAIIVAGSIAAWYGISRARTDKQALAVDGKTVQTDTAARGNIAWLTLGDGTKIKLDSAANGSLAQQGGVRVRKLDAGTLAYGGAVPAGMPVVYNTVSTPRGGQYQVLLPDGSKVWLNAASSLRFPTSFSGGERIVDITGEAFVDVAKDPARPFSVRTGGVKIEALGTSFNVNAYTDEDTIRTTLVEGGVRVSNALFNLVLQPGEQVLLENGTQQVKKVNVARETAWKNGYFQFENASIGFIMRQLARWYSLDVRYEGTIGKRFMATIPRTAPISQVLRVLEYTDAVKFRMTGNEITVMRP